MDPQQPYPPYSDPWGPPTEPVPGTSPMSAVPAPVPTSPPGNAMVPATLPYPVPEALILTIGEIQVTTTSVRTPAGQFPLAGSRWSVSDHWIPEQKIPAWAIVLAILLFFCIGPFSLLFLLAKDTRNVGVVQVHVANGPYSYVSRLPAIDQQYVQRVYQQVNYVRSLAVV